MRYINVIGAIIVLVANMIVSYNHSIQLFQSGGFHGWMAHVAVIGSECTFVMGALNIVVSRLKGVSPGVPAMLGGLLGVALVSWSNVAAGWEYGITGVLLGLATPASLIVAEAILSRAILQRAGEKIGTPAPDNMVIPANATPTNAGSPGSGGLGEEAGETPDTVESPTPAQVETPTPTEVGSPAPTPSNVESPTKVEDGDAAEEIAQAKEIARRFKEENGRLPGRRKLAEIAGCGEWYARKALDELRKTA
ncbi:hypothetical protein JQC72_15975 [Polycladomyces sp. WAk]|uniref:Uncharacterized protein n=1 Tax=Polycladomyces zharkentensis TaxID=2807616 RepID=A0ABS2WN73_9BACL|nr:hypothetical protein [Polycladomyces sp. WAk]MBN2910990.1 hypothetical protein [Polycladomyces sp. WAk]